jgi:hypothetical protein
MPTYRGRQCPVHVSAAIGILPHRGSIGGGFIRGRPDDEALTGAVRRLRNDIEFARPARPSCRDAIIDRGGSA